MSTKLTTNCKISKRLVIGRYVYFYLGADRCTLIHLLIIDVMPWQLSSSWCSQMSLKITCCHKGITSTQGWENRKYKKLHVNIRVLYKITVLPNQLCLGCSQWMIEVAFDSCADPRHPCGGVCPLLPHPTAADPLVMLVTSHPDTNYSI